MTIETIRESLPEYAKDLKLNLGNVLATGFVAQIRLGDEPPAC